MKSRYSIMLDGNIGINGTQLSPERLLELLAERDELLDRVERAKNCLVCSAIADSFEVCEYTLRILEE